MSTVFSKIIAGEIPCHKVYEDEHVLAFLDINPVHKGHTLVIPKHESKSALVASDEDLARILRVGRDIGNAIIQTTEATGINFLMNCGEAAGQEIFHTHLHVIPRVQNDGIYRAPKHESYKSGEADILSMKLQSIMKARTLL